MTRSARPRVFVTRSLPGGALEALEGAAQVDLWREAEPPTPEALREGCRGASGLLCLLHDRVDEDLLDACPELRVVSSVSVGVDHIALERATRRGIPVGHTPGVLTETTADLAFALLLAAARRVAEGDRFVRAGRWLPERGWEPDLLLGRDVHGATLGVIGLGPIGRAVARRAAGFGMRVLGWSRRPRRVAGVEPAELDPLLESSDFVSVHVARVPATVGLLDARAIGRMKPGAVLINTARGGIVDEVALAAALRSGHLSAAGLDVFEVEPLSPHSELMRLPSVVLTPHIGSASRATRARMAQLAVDNLMAGLAGERMPCCANPEVYGGSADCRSG